MLNYTKQLFHFLLVLLTTLSLVVASVLYLLMYFDDYIIATIISIISAIIVTFTIKYQILCSNKIFRNDRRFIVNFINKMYEIMGYPLDFLIRLIK
jgi:hypothetical protein